MFGDFFGPIDLHEEPYIRVAVGDYEDLLKEWFNGDVQKTKDNALAAMLHSIAHELSHYFQWIKRHEEWDGDGTYEEARDERQAVYYASEIVRDYADVVDHP